MENLGIRNEHLPCENLETQQQQIQQQQTKAAEYGLMNRHGLMAFCSGKMLAEKRSKQEEVREYVSILGIRPGDPQ